MTQIDEDAESVHALDGFEPGAAQPGIGRLKAPVAEKIASVVGELNDPQAQAMQVVQPRKIRFERHRVLEAINQPRFAVLLGADDILDRPDAQKNIRMPVDIALPPEHAL